MKTRTLTILSVLAPLACAPDRDAEPHPATVTRDSADIHIVENARPAEGSRLPWRIGPEPAASIGVLEGEEPYMLHNAMDATKLPDGLIGRGLNPGRESSKVKQGCTICVSYQCAGPCWI